MYLLTSAQTKILIGQCNYAVRSESSLYTNAQADLNLLGPNMFECTFSDIMAHTKRVLCECDISWECSLFPTAILLDN